MTLAQWNSFCTSGVGEFAQAFSKAAARRLARPDDALSGAAFKQTRFIQPASTSDMTGQAGSGAGHGAPHAWPAWLQRISDRVGSRLP